MQKPLPGAHHISDYLLATAKLEHDIDLDQLQLNKLCYLVNGFTLRERDEPAFYNDVEAWKYGPVVPEVYKMYRVYGDKPITKLDICRTPLDDSEAVRARQEDLISIIGDEIASISSGVLKAYGQCTGGQLILMTHSKNTPWKKAYKPGRNNVIPTKEIKQFYRNLDAYDVRR